MGTARRATVYNWRQDPKEGSMRRFLIVAILALAVPAAALAGAPTGATIDGPGLDGSVVIPGNGDPDGDSPLGRVVRYSGFFPSVFEQNPNPMLETNPAVTLGPRYSIRYVWPSPAGTSVIYQDVYPDAKPYPVTYMKPGQPLWGAESPEAPPRPDGQQTFGGWYVSSGELKLALEAIGLGATPRSSDGGFWSGTPPLIGLVGGIAGALAAFGLVVAARRRKMRPASMA
jgi:hypothetical protein